MNLKEFLRKNWLKVFLLSVVLYIPIFFTLTPHVIFIIVLPFTDLFESILGPKSTTLYHTVTLVLTPLITIFTLYLLDKSVFLRFEWKKLLITAILFIIVTIHLASCGIITGYPAPCGEITIIENKIMLKAGGLIEFIFLLIPVLYLLSCVIINLLRKILPVKL